MTIKRGTMGRPQVEALEDRCVPALFAYTVNVGTDTDSGGNGVGIGNTGDLRYCVNQAANLHPGNRAQITFASGVNAVVLQATIEFDDGIPITIEGSASHVVTLSQNGGDLGVFYIGSVNNQNSDASITFDYLRLTNSSGFSGAVTTEVPVTIENTRIDHNESHRLGGALFASSRVILLDSTFDDNSTTSGGGAFAVSGGGTTVQVSGCTFSDNTAGADGGAIYDEELFGNLDIVNSTFDGNVARGDGGAVQIMNRAIGELTNCTIVRNSATGNGGGLYTTGGLNLANDVIALNSAPTGADVYESGTIASASHNVIGDGTNSGVSAVNGNQVGTTAHPLNPKVGTLANNGGPTETDAPLAGSPTIDTGDDTVISTVTTDQRGLPRKSGSHVDIGAVEVQQPVAAVAVAPVKVAPPVVHHGRRFGP